MTEERSISQSGHRRPECFMLRPVQMKIKSWVTLVPIYPIWFATRVARIVILLNLIVTKVTQVAILPTLIATKVTLIAILPTLIVTLPILITT